MRRRFLQHVSSGTLVAAAAAAAPLRAAAQGTAADRVVYHFDDTRTQALKGLRSIRNHLDVDPKAKIVVVALAEGIDFLLEGAKDTNGSEYAGPVSALVARGVAFEICEITLASRSLKKDQFLQEATFTPSGVVRLARLQQAGAAYIKP